MLINLKVEKSGGSGKNPLLISAFSQKPSNTTEKKGKKVEIAKSPQAQIAHWSTELKAAFHNHPRNSEFKGEKGEFFQFVESGREVFVIGLGDKAKCTSEVLRRQSANAFNYTRKLCNDLQVAVEEFNTLKNIELTTKALAEAALLSSYKFDKYLSKTTKDKLQNIDFVISDKKHLVRCQKSLKDAATTCDAIQFARDLVNEPPNVLNSEVYAKLIENDVKENLTSVKVQILNKAAIKKQNMNLLLAVNAGSAHEPRVVHLTYSPAGAKRHIALVGKGLTFDTGGYSLKPSNSMENMKFDMAGSATVYAAFRAAVQMKMKVKISCFLGITDNMISGSATTPDAIVKSRNGKTVEILNTDAEGRLVLADVLDYACEQNPDTIIDAATLTGACLVALGTEVCGLMGNDKGLMSNLKKAADEESEYIWELPIIDEYRNDMKASIADLRNVSPGRFAGTSKAAAFLENFIKGDIKWAHLDIAGVGDSQSHLSYCPKKGASGTMVRTLINFLKNA